MDEWSGPCEARLSSDDPEEQKARHLEGGRKLMEMIGKTEPDGIATGLYGHVVRHGQQLSITAPWPTPDCETLHVVAHEVAHWFLHYVRVDGDLRIDGQPSYLREYQAEQHARRLLKKVGCGGCAEYSVYSARKYVAKHVRAFLARSTEDPPAEILQWTNVNLADERNVEWGYLTMKMLPRDSMSRRCADFVFLTRDKPRHWSDTIKVDCRTKRSRWWCQYSLPNAAQRDSYRRLRYREIPLRTLHDFVFYSQKAGLLFART